MRKFTLTIAAIIVSSLTFAQDVNVLQCNFNDSTSFNIFGYYDFNEDGASWDVYEGAGTDSSVAMGYVATTDTADEYALSPEFELSTEHDYELRFNYKQYFENYTEKLNVILYSVANDSINKYRTMLYENETISNTDFENAIVSFTVPITQKYRLIFSCFSDPDQGALIIDDISLTYFQTGIANNKDAKMDIFPNPTTGILNIAKAEGATVEVRDLLGNIVASKKMGAATKGNIDLSSLSNGIYMVKITKGDKVTTRKINLIR